MTEETQPEDAVQTDASVPSDNCPVQSDAQTNSLDSAKTKDNKKEKCRPQTKVVIRRLPPTMTQEQFIEQVSPLPDHDYFHFSKADMSLGQFAFCRAYINFVDQKDIFVFQEKFDNYVFIDSKGVEYPSVVEFAPFQRLPKKRAGKKKDLKCGTIESDPYYMSFLDSLKNQEVDSSTIQSKTEYSYQPPDNTAKKVTTTPLLEYLKLRKQEKQRIKDEKREERRKRDLERRRTKDDAVISKFLRNLDVDKESRDDKENKDERDKFSPKDMKNRIKRDEKMREKSLRDRETKTIIKGYRVDDRNKERDMKQRRYDEKKVYGRRDEREIVREERRFDLKDDRRYETKEEFRETKDRKVEERRGKSYEKMRQEKKKLADMKKQIADANGDDASSTKVKDEEHDTTQEEEDRNNTESVLNEHDSKLSARDDDCKQRETAEDRVADATQTTCPDGTEEENGPINTDANNKEASEEKELKVVKRRNSLESSSEGGAGDGNCLRRHKSLDGGGQSDLQKNENEEKEKDKKDPRLERRIRNKDRPAMEIYRPGMGKFSKQRLEREKSNNDDRASLSQSPTPNSNTQTNKSGKSGTTEVRSMTFKRSFARDAA